MLTPDFREELRLAFDDDRDADAFLLRLDRYWPDLTAALGTVYPDALADLERTLATRMVMSYHERPVDLKRLDHARLLQGDWLQHPSTTGYVAYTDRFAGTLKGVHEHLDYLSDLGVTYLHLMPLLKPRPGENDGGYAVMDYRAVRGDLGTMQDLAALTRALRERGISLCLDLVLNHVAREHSWAQKARSGNRKYRQYFHLYADRTVPDQYEQTLPEVFPDFAPGNFTWDDDAQSWVWTTFNAYQWDLNWANPDVFVEFCDILMYLANRGVEIFRLDAIAFLWKRLGTDCQNQPEVHAITQALRAVMRIVAPAVAFKAEAIVAPHQLIHYLGRGEHYGKVSDLAYHNSLMVQIWSSLASRDVTLLERALAHFPEKPATTTWATYLRCHDDIGWAIADADALAVGLSGDGHRRFLSDFYSGEFPGTFARGLVFQHNPRTGDRRVSGSAASLAGLERALEDGDAREMHLSLARLRLGHAVVLGFGGVPLLYMGDELAMLNDYSFQDVPEHAADNRWVHRPRMDWARAQRRADLGTPEGRMYTALAHLLRARRSLPQLHAGVESRVRHNPNPHVLILTREHPVGRLVQVYNFSEAPQTLDARVFEPYGWPVAVDRITGLRLPLGADEVEIAPYAHLWLTAP
ncbi:amylosucrase [Deinococcus maricopensis]|uniref:Amylosucrase n=1 Tax=Deinococcus maricopensis (strain DSM 21211 / LMG 22137 / NRRL B-23946 / LB-34) TaxID=709986 RepID=E8UBB9_DEIML|nr:amylosucrase [Deinococcus maricopensis]ADV68358.1 Amylosucrase [Deinococcus maricopensis DSM 21211]